MPSVQPQALLTTIIPFASNTQDWFIDTGATHYLTSDQHAFHQFNPYSSKASILLRNGGALSITPLGNACFSSESCNMKLQSLLGVPQLEKSLVFVRKLCEDNHVSVKSFPITFSVKDLTTRTTLLIWVTKDGL